MNTKLNKFDYIIIGQGIAGSVMALTLQQANKKVLIIDQNWQDSSSLVAAGIVNPVTGRRLVKSWKIDELLPVSLKFYKKLEQVLNVKFIKETSILRVFENVGEQNDFLSKTADPKFHDYLKEGSFDLIPKGVNADLYFGEIINSYFMNTPVFLEAVRKVFESENAFVATKFDFSDLKILENEINVSIEGEVFQAPKIIFCEGHKMTENPYFNYLPLSPNKGEFLLIKSAELPRERLIKKGVMIVPVQTDKFWVGATYDHFDLSLKNTEEGKSKMLTKLKKAIKVAFEVVDCGFGIRPATKDRRPLIGQHPEHNNLYLFNGMGSKGVSLSPFFAQQLLKNLETQTPLDPQVNINRFKLG